MNGMKLSVGVWTSERKDCVSVEEVGGITICLYGENCKLMKNSMNAK